MYHHNIRTFNKIICLSGYQPFAVTAGAHYRHPNILGSLPKPPVAGTGSVGTGSVAAARSSTDRREFGDRTRGKSNLRYTRF